MSSYEVPGVLFMAATRRGARARVNQANRATTWSSLSLYAAKSTGFTDLSGPPETIQLSLSERLTVLLPPLCN